MHSVAHSKCTKERRAEIRGLINLDVFCAHTVFTVCPNASFQYESYALFNTQGPQETTLVLALLRLIKLEIH